MQAGGAAGTIRVGVMTKVVAVQRSQRAVQVLVVPPMGGDCTLADVQAGVSRVPDRPEPRPTLISAAAIYEGPEIRSGVARLAVRALDVARVGVVVLAQPLAAMRVRAAGHGTDLD